MFVLENKCGWVYSVVAVLLSPATLPGGVHLLATTNGGLEFVAADELEGLCGADAATHHRGVLE